MVLVDPVTGHTGIVPRVSPLGLLHPQNGAVLLTAQVGVAVVLDHLPVLPPGVADSLLGVGHGYTGVQDVGVYVHIQGLLALPVLRQSSQIFYTGLI